MAAPRSWSVSRRSVSSFPSPARPKPEAPGTMRILIAGGGSGGHILPALAVVRSLRERRTDVTPLCVGGHRGLEASLVPGAHIPLTRLWLRSLRTVDRSLSTFLYPLRLAGSVPQALLLLARWQPRAVFTTGGYVAIPVLLAARLLRVPSLLWEGNLVPGRSVRATAGLASAIAVSFEATGRALPGPCYVAGTPTRPPAGPGGAAAPGRGGGGGRAGGRGGGGPPPRGPPRGPRPAAAAAGRPRWRGRPGAAGHRDERAGRPRLRRLAGRAPLRRCRGRRTALARPAGHGDPRHRRGGLRRRPAPPRGAARGSSPALPALRLPARGDGRRPGRRRPRRRARRLVHAGRGDRAGPAHGRRALSSRRRPPAGECAHARRGGRGHRDRGRGLRRRRAPRGRVRARRCGAPGRDGRRQPQPGPAGRRRRERGIAAGPGRAAPAARRRGHRGHRTGRRGPVGGAAGG